MVVVPWWWTGRSVVVVVEVVVLVVVVDVVVVMVVVVVVVMVVAIVVSWIVVVTRLRRSRLVGSPRRCSSSRRGRRRRRRYGSNISSYLSHQRLFGYTRGYIRVAMYTMSTCTTSLLHARREGMPACPSFLSAAGKARLCWRLALADWTSALRSRRSVCVDV